MGSKQEKYLRRVIWVMTAKMLRFQYLSVKRIRMDDNCIAYNQYGYQCELSVLAPTK